MSDENGICALFSFSFGNFVLYQLRGLFIGLVSVEAVGLKGRKRKNRIYRESSSALTIIEFSCKLYASIRPDVRRKHRHMSRTGELYKAHAIVRAGQDVCNYDGLGGTRVTLV